MKKSLIRCLFVAVVCVLVSACTTTSTQTTVVLTTLATDVAYVGYRVSPEARTALNAICLLSSLEDSTELAIKLKDLLGTVWVDANKITNNDAAYALLGVNNIVGLLGLNTTTSASLASLKQVISGICSGVSLAQKVT